MKSALRTAWFGLASGALLLGACGKDVQIAADPLAADASSGGGSGDSGVAGALGQCQGKIYQCGDLIDNDQDGLIDAEDPDCLGACDNTEDSFYGGIPGQNAAPCKQDCYFDQDTGAGNDDCYWNHQCDPLAQAPSFPPSADAKCAHDPAANTAGTTKTCSELEAAQSAKCLDYCRPLTPNGCDCFGCCELPAGSGSYVWLGSTDGNVGSCDRDNLLDPAKCHPCTPVKSCFNDCGPCELCVGRESPAPDCAEDAGADGGEAEQCASGMQPCGAAGQAACPPGAYCITGCCIQVPR